MKCFYCKSKTNDPIELHLAGRIVYFCSPECYVTAGLRAIGREYEVKYNRTDVLELANQVREKFFYVYGK